MTPIDFATLALPAVNTVGLFLLLRSQKRTANGGDAGRHGHGSLTDRVTIQLGEMELRLGERISSLETQIRLDQDQLHERLEYLERRDRERPQ